MATDGHPTSIESPQTAAGTLQCPITTGDRLPLACSRRDLLTRSQSHCVREDRHGSLPRPSQRPSPVNSPMNSGGAGKPPMNNAVQQPPLPPTSMIQPPTPTSSIQQPTGMHPPPPPSMHHPHHRVHKRTQLWEPTCTQGDTALRARHRQCAWQRLQLPQSFCCCPHQQPQGHVNAGGASDNILSSCNNLSHSPVLSLQVTRMPVPAGVAPMVFSTRQTITITKTSTSAPTLIT